VVDYDTLYVDWSAVQYNHAGDELSWNVHGLTRDKKESIDFVNIVAKYDICFCMKLSVIHSLI